MFLSSFGIIDFIRIGRQIMTAFLSELVSYVLKFAILFACSAAGIYFGVGRAKAKKKES